MIAMASCCTIALHASEHRHLPGLNGIARQHIATRGRRDMSRNSFFININRTRNGTTGTREYRELPAGQQPAGHHPRAERPRERINDMD